MLRRITAVGLTLAVQMGAVYAPFVHAHIDEDESAHHRGRQLHAHLAGHPGSESGSHEADGPPHLGGDGERTLTVQLFVAESADPARAPGLVRAEFVFTPPVDCTFRRAPRVVHGHDPPALTHRIPRAPPRLLA